MFFSFQNIELTRNHKPLRRLCLLCQTFALPALSTPFQTEQSHAMAYLSGNPRLRHFLLGKHYLQLCALHSPPRRRERYVCMVHARAKMLRPVSASCGCAGGF